MFASGGSVALSWQSRDGIAKYRLQKLVGFGNWQTLSDSITGTGYIETGVACPTMNYYSISAYGDGTTYAAQWGPTASASKGMQCQ